VSIVIVVKLLSLSDFESVDEGKMDEDVGEKLVVDDVIASGWRHR
jgi:hypothetical protein